MDLRFISLHSVTRRDERVEQRRAAGVRFNYDSSQRFAPTRPPGALNTDDSMKFQSIPSCSLKIISLNSYFDSLLNSAHSITPFGVR